MREDERLQRAMRDLPRHEPSLDFTDQVMARLRAQPVEVRAQGHATRLLLAAVVLLAVGGGVAAHQVSTARHEAELARSQARAAAIEVERARLDALRAEYSALQDELRRISQARARAPRVIPIPGDASPDVFVDFRPASDGRAGRAPRVMPARFERMEVPR